MKVFPAQLRLLCVLLAIIIGYTPTVAIAAEARSHTAAEFWPQPGEYHPGTGMIGTNDALHSTLYGDAQRSHRQASTHHVRMINLKSLPPGMGPFGPLGPRFPQAVPEVALGRTTASGTLDNRQAIQGHLASSYFANRGTVSGVRPVVGRMAASAVGTPTFTVYPNATTISRSRTITIQGSGTSWTSGTTFSINNGSASVVFGSISGQKVTATLNPGPSTGTFTISDSVDSATATVTVSNTLTTSGTGTLTAYTAAPTYVFDATNEFTADCVGHTFQISGGTGFTAGTYGCNQVQIGAVLSGGQGTHNIAQLYQIGSSTVGPATGAASGGSYSWFMGPGGSGYSGANGVSWFKGGGVYMFDPDSPCASGLNGTSIAISGGTGATAGTYTVTAYNSAFATAGQGTQNLVKYAVAPGAQGWDHVTWALVGGTIIPTPVVNTAFAGPIRVLLIGDSITQRQTTTTATALAAQYPNASSITVNNQGQSGSQTTDWLIGASSNYLNTAITAANSMGATVVSIMLGTNDALHGPMAQATHTANIQAIVNSLRANIPTLVSIVLQEQPALGSNISGYAADNTLLQSYFASYSSVTGATQGFSSSSAATITNYAFFSNNPQDLQDGIHPTTAGTAEVNYTWLTSMTSAITNTGPPSLTSAAINPSGTTITALFTSGNAPLLGTSTAGWTVVVNGTADPVSAVSWSGTTGTLTLTNPALPGSATLAYDATMGSVTDSAGTPQALATITTQALTNNSVLGTITSAPTATYTSGSSTATTLTYNFTVTEATHGVTTIANVNGTTLTLGGSATINGANVTFGGSDTSPVFSITSWAPGTNPQFSFTFASKNALSSGGLGPYTSSPITLFANSGGGRRILQ